MFFFGGAAAAPSTSAIDGETIRRSTTSRIVGRAYRYGPGAGAGVAVALSAVQGNELDVLGKKALQVGGAARGAHGRHKPDIGAPRLLSKGRGITQVFDMQAWRCMGGGLWKGC